MGVAERNMYVSKDFLRIGKKSQLQSAKSRRLVVELCILYAIDTCDGLVHWKLHSVC